MITARIRCTVENNMTGRREDRYEGAKVHFRLLNIDEIDTLSDWLSQAFSIAIERFHHPDKPSSIILVDNVL